ncbi:ABC transporter ATP-binding protein [Paenibacillus sp. P96]|uniref:ABC transporter ATP-binding protein n=1 Tax=Paenibacillus zeirhizosphaerae TaxID=2987519 RepID=A0ABT9FKL6_9BACL|nr:ABC transporter ATP-binding protein [Paenibacillus sp. P96]MDP4095269.1 ABC transporter ATP-binding protein [Paenibacillus sp. P96]
MPHNNESIVVVTDVKKHFKQRGHSLSLFGRGKKTGTIKSVDGVSFALGKGEVLGVIGESGCGKSTLGKLLVHLESPTSGEIGILGEPSGDMLKRSPLAFRRKAQIIFQNPFDTFDPRHTIARILTDTLRLHGVGRSHEERLVLCEQRMEQAGLFPARDYLHRFPHELSGGQLQRISILRSMLLDPLFLVADEPISMLDVSIRADIINMLSDMCRSQNTSMVFISHDITTTRYISDRIAVMYLGRFVEIGPTDEVLHRPQHPYTKALISNSAPLDATGEQEIIRIDGEPPTPVDTGPGCYFYDRCYQRREECRLHYPTYRTVSPEHQVACPYSSADVSS